MKKTAVFLTIIIAAVLWIASSAAAWEPLGYPYSTWGQVGETMGSRVHLNGLLADMYFEQGIDWFRLGRPNLIFNTFAGFRLTQNAYDDPYGDKYGPWFGAKVKLDDINPFHNGWGQLVVGVRGEYDHRPQFQRDDLRAVVFFQWSLGGDWKKRQ